MSGVFGGGPKKPDIPKQRKVEDVQVINEEAEEAKKRERKRLAIGGRQGTILSGIQSALKKRLGE